MGKTLSFNQIRATGARGLDLGTSGLVLLMGHPAWDGIREGLTDQIFMEVAIHIRFQLKSSTVPADKD